MRTAARGKENADKTQKRKSSFITCRSKLADAEKSKPHLVKLIWKVVIYRSYISIIIKLVKNKSA